MTNRLDQVAQGTQCKQTEVRRSQASKNGMFLPYSYSLPLTVLSAPVCSQPAKPCAYFSRLIHQLFCPCLLLLPPVYLILIAKQGQTQQWTWTIHFLNKWRENVNYFSLLSKEKTKPTIFGEGRVIFSLSQCDSPSRQCVSEIYSNCSGLSPDRKKLYWILNSVPNEESHFSGYWEIILSFVFLFSY